VFRHIWADFGLAFLVVGCTTSTTPQSTTSLPVTTTESSAPDVSSTTEVNDFARTFLEDFFTSQLTEAEISQSSIDCFVDEAIESGMAGEIDALDPEDAEAVGRFLTDFVDLTLGSGCLSHEESDRLSLASSIPSSFGDNAELDRLWTACSEGDFTSCDLLWIVSGSPTDYETFGYTCGERSTDPGDEWCVDLHGTGPDYQLLHTECEEGEFGSCDLLAWYSAQEDEDFEFGATCGGRVEATEIQCFFQFGEADRP
jgi:hypothetical protein